MIFMYIFRKSPVSLLSHRSFKHFHHLNPFAKKSTWAIFLPIPLAFGNGISLNLKTRDGRENSQSSHRKSPKSPYGGISPNIVYETCRASNSVWKIGITSFIRMTQSIVRPIENVAFLRISDIFETLLLWTASFK